LNAIAIDILKKVIPYLIAFLLGVILTWKGCGSSEDSAEAIIKNPVGKVEYVDRWNTDTVRFVKTVVRRDVIRDTITQIVPDIRLDTITVIDTVSIVEAWLTELVKYDTAVTLNGVNVALKWQNYQNLSEQLSIAVSCLAWSTRKRWPDKRLFLVICSVIRPRLTGNCKKHVH
jgi:hypothetical protein